MPSMLHAALPLALVALLLPAAQAKEAVNPLQLRPIEQALLQFSDLTLFQRIGRLQQQRIDRLLCLRGRHQQRDQRQR